MANRKKAAMKSTIIARDYLVKQIKIEKRSLKEIAREEVFDVISKAGEKLDKRAKKGVENLFARLNSHGAPTEGIPPQKAAKTAAPAEESTQTKAEPSDSKRRGGRRKSADTVYAMIHQLSHSIKDLLILLPGDHEVLITRSKVGVNS